MKKILILFITILFFGCSQSTPKAKKKIIYGPTFECESDIIINKKYAFGNKIEYRTRIVQINNVDYNSNDILGLLNRQDFFGGADIEFKLDGVVTEYLPDTISYKKILNDFYKSGDITIIIIPDSMVLTEPSYGIIQGAANGIPNPLNTSTGKPSLFIRETAAKDKILCHEMGHVFGLLHTFEGMDMTNKGLNCGSGDRNPLTVTPHPLGGVVIEDCKYYLPDDISEYYSEEELINMVTSPMSYSPPSCMKGFDRSSHQKIKKMAEINPRLQDCEIK